MGKIIPFRSLDESCENCWYYMIPKEPKKKVEKEECHKDCQHEHQHESPKEDDLPLHNYCKHPDRMKEGCVSRLNIKQQGLHQEPGDWCPKYTSDDSPIMKMLQFLGEMKFTLLNMRFANRGAGGGNLDGASEAYRELVDQFYLGNKKIMTINQYKAAKRDPKYFSTYIDETFDLYKKMSRE